ncbi:phosphatidylinositide phosphatase SAC1-like, partial [Trifolium medium]|nr:phosphatidylinositide phosphatase SAC1-like [Trifolium medium]
ELKLKDSCAKLTLISRRCTRRLGTRMWRRGANFEGDTANFIETEQLLELEEFKFSFLQVLFYINEYLTPVFPFDSFSLQ